MEETTEVSNTCTSQLEASIWMRAKGGSALTPPLFRKFAD